MRAKLMQEQQQQQQQQLLLLTGARTPEVNMRVFEPLTQPRM